MTIDFSTYMTQCSPKLTVPYLAQGYSLIEIPVLSGDMVKYMQYHVEKYKHYYDIMLVK